MTLLSANMRWTQLKEGVLSFFNNFGALYAVEILLFFCVIFFVSKVLRDNEATKLMILYWFMLLAGACMRVFDDTVMTPSFYLIYVVIISFMMLILFSVYVPCTMSTIVEMYSYYFVNAMITISAVSFLVNFRTMPLSLLIPQLESQSFIEGTALVSLLILIINLGEKGVAFFLKKYLRKKEKANSEG